MEYKDYYQILEVPREASQDDIKQSYRKLARKYHPDVSKEADAERRFKDLGEAYEVLNDPEKRAAYDRFGANWQNGQDFEPPPDWNAGFQFGGAGYTGGGEHGFSDFFETLFGRGSGQERPGQRPGFQAQGQDQHAKITIRLIDAYLGSRQQITLNRTIITDDGHIRVEPQTLQVSIPKGIIEGQRIRLEGQGGPGLGGGPAGDLFLEIVFQEDPLFKAIKRDIYLTLPVTPWEAALGTTVTVPTLGGKVQLKIPANSSGGRQLRLKGRGLSSANNQGDQYVTLKIIAPAALTEEQKELYRQMSTIMPVNPREHMGV
ncbi:MAG: cytochrome C biogenesis protein [Desulfobulbus propionicus]|nr:MAG: cytochrome C biogenesis protein [Desulfobulbus propionicus]